MNLVHIAIRIAARSVPDIETLEKYIGKPGVYFSWAGGVNDAEPDSPFGLSLNRNHSGYDNHWGVWAYRLTSKSINLQFGNENWAYAVGSRDLYIFKVKHPDRMLVTTQYTDNDYQVDMAELIKLGLCDVRADSQRESHHHERRNRWLEGHEEGDPEYELNLDSPFQKLEDLIVICGIDGYKKSSPEWYRSVYTKLGYVGIDDELGLIDSIGDVAVIFDVREIDILEKIHRTDSYRENNKNRGVQDAWRTALRVMRNGSPQKCFEAFADFVSAYYKLGGSCRTLESSPMTAKLIRLLADALLRSNEDAEAFMGKNGFPLLAEELKKRDRGSYSDLPVAYEDLEDMWDSRIRADVRSHEV